MFNGGVAGSINEIIAQVAGLSKALSAAGVEHSFEVYDADQNLICVVPMPPKGRDE